VNDKTPAGSESSSLSSPITIAANH